MAQQDDKLLKIPPVLLSSYHAFMKNSSRQQSQTELKRIAVQCGVCRLTRYYSLTRGITSINRVVVCVACKHCYQAFQRQPEQLHCSKSDGSCLQMSLFTKTMCRCCWVAQIIEYTPLSVHAYNYFMQYLPPYVRSKLRGRPILASSLTQQQRGFLSLEVHTGADWKDVTGLEAIAKQRLPLSDESSDAESETQISVPFPPKKASEPSATLAPVTGNTTPATSTAANPTTTRPLSPASNIKKTIESIISDISSSSNSSSSSDLASNLNSFVIPQPSTRGKNVAIRGKKIRGKGPYKGAVTEKSTSENTLLSSTVRGRAAKTSRGSVAKRGRGGGKKGPSKVERLMAGIKEGLYGMTVSDDDGKNDGKTGAKPPGEPGSTEMSSSSTETSASNSGAPSPTPMEEDVVVEEFEEASTALPVTAPRKTKSQASVAAKDKKTDGPMIGLVHSEQVKYLKDFNPRNSNRVRRKKDRVEYFDNPKEKKTQETLVYDHKGRFISSDKSLHDVCDCLRSDCPGCHFPCSKCRSLKCGAECRINRKWFYEHVDVEGTEQFYLNELVK